MAAEDAAAGRPREALATHAPRSYVPRMPTALLLVDHGSRRAAANEMLAEAAKLVRAEATELHVEHAHMELAPPSLAEGFARCVAAGATHVVVFPWMLSAGRHATEDVPRLAAEAASAHQGVRYEVAAPFGLDAKLAHLALERAGLWRPRD